MTGSGQDKNCFLLALNSKNHLFHDTILGKKLGKGKKIQRCVKMR